MERELTVPETYHASELIEQNGHLTYFAEHAVSISTFLDTQESFQKAQVKDMCGGDFFRKHMSEKKWPILDNHTDQLTCQSKDLEKP